MRPGAGWEARHHGVLPPRDVRLRGPGAAARAGRRHPDDHPRPPRSPERAALGDGPRPDRLGRCRRHGSRRPRRGRHRAPAERSARATTSSAAWTTAGRTSRRCAGACSDATTPWPPPPAREDVARTPKPIVAALNGRCHGAGFGDRLGVRLPGRARRRPARRHPLGKAIFANQGVGLLLPRLIGQARAMDLLMTGRVIDAVEAERIGLRRPGVVGRRVRPPSSTRSSASWRRARRGPTRPGS